MKQQWTATDSLRPKDWRWQRVEQLSDPRHSRKPAKGDDKLTRDAMKFHVTYRRINTPPCGDSLKDKIDLYQKYSIISNAFEIEAQGAFIRYATEALILAGVSTETIAEQVGCDVAIIQAYEKLYFDIRDRLEYPLFIRSEVLTCSVAAGLSGRDFDFFWKSIAYNCGPDILQAMWSLGQLTQSNRELFQTITEDMMRKNAFTASLVRDVSKYNSGEVLQEYMGLLTIEQSRGMRGALAAMDEGAGLLMSAIQVTVASVREVPKAVEPKAADVIKRLAAGKTYVKESV